MLIRNGVVISEQESPLWLFPLLSIIRMWENACSYGKGGFINTGYLIHINSGLGITTAARLNETHC